MKINMPTVNSNVKLITSNQAPTTSNLAKGEMAFGQVGGVNSIYGNTGNGIIKIEFTASGEPIIYFANEEALTTFVEGDDVPASGWYATVADTVYEQYGEWVVFTLSPMITSTWGGTFDMSKISGSSNGDSFYSLLNEVDHGPDGVGSEIQFGNYAHSRYFLYLDCSEDSTTNWTAEFHFENKASYRVSIKDMDKIGDNRPGHLEVTMDNYTANPQVAEEDNKNMHITAASLGRVNLSGYLVVKEILSDGEPWINWDEIIALDSGEEPEPTESYVQFDLSTELPLGNYINSVSFSNRQQVGDYPLGGGWNIDLASGGSNNIDISAGASAHSQRLRISVDAWIDKFSNPGYAIPDMNVNISYTGTTIHAISGVYEQAKKRISWSGSFEVTDTGETPAIARDVLTNLWVAIMRYYDTGSPTLKGTIKFEAIDG